METIWILGPMMGMCAGIIAVALDPSIVWIRSRPDYWLAIFAAIVLVALIAMYVAFVISDKRLTKAVELTARMNGLSEAQRHKLTEPDTSFEPNSGLRRWKKGITPPPLAKNTPLCDMPDEQNAIFSNGGGDRTREGVVL